MNKPTLQFPFNRPWPCKNSHASTSLLRKALLDVWPGYSLILLIGICKDAVKLGPPPPLTAKIHTFFLFFNKFISDNLRK